MSVVRADARRRWAAVAGLVALVLVPTAWVRSGGPPPGNDPASARDLLRRALASRTVAYTALGESRGTLGLPTLPRLGAVAELLGGTTRTRVWWSAPDQWRGGDLTTTRARGPDRGPPGGVARGHRSRRPQTPGGAAGD